MVPQEHQAKHPRASGQVAPGLEQGLVADRILQDRANRERGEALHD